jgi:integrase
MASERLRFTRAAVAAIAPPASGRSYYRDETQAGLVLDVTANGAKTFQLYRKVGGRPFRIALGRFDPDLPESRELSREQTDGKPLDPLVFVGNTPRLNVRMARALAVAVSASLDRGENPAAEKRERRRVAAEELTLRAAFELYYSDHLIPQGRRKSDEMANMFARYLGTVAPGQRKPRGQERKKSPGAVDWEGRRLSTISPGDVRRMMSSLKDGGSLYAANMAFVLLRAVYRKMAEWRLYNGSNPCDGISKYPEKERVRFIKSDELPDLFAALSTAPENIRHFVILALTTGARRSNIAAMRWADLDLHNALWTVPGEVSKNGSAMAIPLTAIAIDILQARAGVSNTWVFPAKSVSGHMVDPKKAWKAVLATAGLEDLRIHDLRRSLGSWAAIHGASLAIIGAALGHKSTDATRIYARLTMDPVREAMEKATNAMMAAVKQKHGAETKPSSPPKRNSVA